VELGGEGISVLGAGMGEEGLQCGG
jgi:hypothetical protein